MFLDIAERYIALGKAYAARACAKYSLESLDFEENDLIYTVQLGGFIGSLQKLEPTVEYNRITEQRIEDALKRREPLHQLLFDLFKPKN